VNGQLVMHEQFCIHVIECPPDAFMHVITIMNEDMNAGVFRKRAKVLISTDVKAGAFSEYGRVYGRGSRVHPEHGEDWTVGAARVARG
jgi:hypothetical protein